MSHLRGIPRPVPLAALLCLGAAVTALAAPFAALAQAAPGTTPGAAPADDRNRVGEIIVTAQRRGQRLQDVPLSVTAFSGATLAQSGITKVGDIGQVDPALNINGGSGVIVPFLRGIGNPSGETVGNESSVPIYIDDVYYTRLNTAYLDLANIERVEVLKGPQGTLFGRNSSGGLIQIITRDPGSTPVLEAKVGYGSFDTVSGKLYASTPITQDIAADLSVSYHHQGDGWGTNLFDGKDIYKDKAINLRSKVVAHITDTTKVTLSGFYVHQFGDIGLVGSRIRGTIGGTPPLYGTPQPINPDNFGFYDYDNDHRGTDRHTGWGGAAKLEQGIGSIDFVSISAYRKAKDLYDSEGDFSPFPYLRYKLHEIDKQFSQEFQLKSKPSAPFDWILGAYYLSTKDGYDPGHIIGDALGAGNSEDIYGIQRVHSYSAYGQTTFHVIPAGTNVTLGLRYTADHVNGQGTNTINLAGVGSFPVEPDFKDTQVFKKLTYKVVVDHKFTRDVMAYASISRGYKSGTFNTLPLDLPPVKAETVDSYEIGIKTQLFDRRLQFNAAIFQNDIKNPQVQIIRNLLVALANAQKARVRGAEFNANAVLGGGLSARLGVTYLDAKYVKFTDAPFNLPVVDPATGLPAPPYGLFVAPGDASGNTLARVPKWRLTGGLNYDQQTSAGRFTLDTNLAYTGRFAFDADNIIHQRAYLLVNADLTYHLPDNDRWSLRLWVANLTDKKYYVQETPVNSGNGNLSAPGAPRTFGVEVGVKL